MISHAVLNAMMMRTARKQLRCAIMKTRSIAQEIHMELVMEAVHALKTSGVVMLMIIVRTVITVGMGLLTAEKNVNLVMSVLDACQKAQQHIYV